MENVAGIIFIVEDLEQSLGFYQNIGFNLIKQVPDVAYTVVYNGFWIELLHKSKMVSEEYKTDIQTTQKSAGAYLQIEVKDIDGFYEKIKNKGISTTNAPKDFSWGHREFILTDPNGYKLAFFSKI